MGVSLAFVLALLPFISQVSAFGRCDPDIIANIRNSNLKAFQQPKPASFKNQVFNYNFVSASDKKRFQSADIFFDDSCDDIVLTATLNRYLGNSESQVSTPIKFVERGDDYGVDFKGFIDSPSSRNQVYIFDVEDVVVAYYCSLDKPKTGQPLFTINTPIDNCVITDRQLNAVQRTIKKLNNNVAVPLAELRTPPTSCC